MEDFIKGLILAVREGLISKALAFAYINGFVFKRYDICYTDEALEKILKKNKIYCQIKQ